MIANFFSKANQTFGIGRLYAVGSGAERAGLFDILWQSGATQDNNGKTEFLLLITTPAKDIEPIEFWHLQVQQHDSGKRELLPIHVPALTGEVVDCFSSVAHNDQRITDPGS